MDAPSLFVNEIVYSKRSIFKSNAWGLFTTLHGPVQVSTLVLQIYIAFAPRTKRLLYVLRCGRRLVKIVPNDLCVVSVQWKTWPSDDMTSSMSRIFYLQINPREPLILSLGSIAHDTKAWWFCPLYHPSSTAFVSKNRNHCTICWILPKAGPKVWFPKVLSRWRSWVGLVVCLLKKSASMSAGFLKGVVPLPNSTCCLQKCFLISMCLVAGLLDRCRPIVIAPLLSQKPW